MHLPHVGQCPTHLATGFSRHGSLSSRFKAGPACRAEFTIRRATEKTVWLSVSKRLGHPPGRAEIWALILYDKPVRLCSFNSRTKYTVLGFGTGTNTDVRCLCPRVTCPKSQRKCVAQLEIKPRAPKFQFLNCICFSLMPAEAFITSGRTGSGYYHPCYSDGNGNTETLEDLHKVSMGICGQVVNGSRARLQALLSRLFLHHSLPPSLEKGEQRADRMA